MSMRPTTEERLEALERDIRLSETLRMGLERDVLQKSQQLTEMRNVEQTLRDAVTELATQLVEEKQRASRREQNLLDENSRLVEARRAAEQTLDLIKGGIAALTEQKLALLVENNRLRAGNFTREEIHGFCHHLAETVPREEFERGCKEYQQRLYPQEPSTHAADSAESR